MEILMSVTRLFCSACHSLLPQRFDMKDDFVFLGLMAKLYFTLVFFYTVP